MTLNSPSGRRKRFFWEAEPDPWAFNKNNYNRLLGWMNYSHGREKAVREAIRKDRERNSLEVAATICQADLSQSDTICKCGINEPHHQVKFSHRGSTYRTCPYLLVMKWVKLYITKGVEVEFDFNQVMAIARENGTINPIELYETINEIQT